METDPEESRLQRMDEDQLDVGGTKREMDSLSDQESHAGLD